MIDHRQDSLAWEDPRSNRGYVKIGRERVTQSADADEIKALRAKAPDFKEVCCLLTCKLLCSILADHGDRA